MKSMYIVKSKKRVNKECVITYSNEYSHKQMHNCITRAQSKTLNTLKNKKRRTKKSPIKYQVEVCDILSFLREVFERC